MKNWIEPHLLYWLEDNLAACILEELLPTVSAILSCGVLHTLVCVLLNSYLITLNNISEHHCFKTPQFNLQKSRLYLLSWYTPYKSAHSGGLWPSASFMMFHCLLFTYNSQEKMFKYLLTCTYCKLFLISMPIMLQVYSQRCMLYTYMFACRYTPVMTL